jgi:hypothetical protein
MDKVIEIMIEQDIIKCLNYYGIEGTQEKIIDLYKHNLSIRDAYLRVYNEILKRKKNV